MSQPNPRSLFLLLCTALLLSQGCAETSEPPPTCESQEDCGQGSCTGEVCVRCGEELSCALGANACDAGSGRCRACASDSECGGALPFCRASKCVQCTQDTHCGGATPFCNGIHCVSCRTNTDCGEGRSCSTAGFCTNSCGTDAACPASAPRCYGAFGVCVECLSDADCDPGQTCFKTACRQPLPGTSCDSPLALDLASGEARVGGDLRPYWHLTSTFGTNAGYFRFTVTQDVKLSGALFFEGSVTRGALAIASSNCSKVVARTTVDTFSEGAWRLRDVSLAPGTYIAVVSQEVVQEGLQGPFTLHLWTSTSATGSAP
jgi:Cys-rich repeat protein